MKIKLSLKETCMVAQCINVAMSTNKKVSKDTNFSEIDTTKTDNVASSIVSLIKNSERKNMYTIRPNSSLGITLDINEEYFSDCLDIVSDGSELILTQILGFIGILSILKKKNDKLIAKYSVVAETPNES